MSRSQHKPRANAVKRKKRPSAALWPQLQHPAGQAGQQEEPLWKRELEEIRGRRFASAEAAWSAVTEAVLARMQLTPEARRETAEFLKLILETDPELRAELDAIVIEKR